MVCYDFAEMQLFENLEYESAKKSKYWKKLHLKFLAMHITNQKLIRLEIYKISLWNMIFTLMNWWMMNAL